MILDVIACAFWCIGILTLVWCLTGWLLLPLSKRQMTILLPQKDGCALERQLRTNAWLRAAGLEGGAVYVVSDALGADEKKEAELFAQDRDYIQLVTRAQLCSILKMGSNDDETGRTDDSRHGAKCAVSESGKRI